MKVILRGLLFLSLLSMTPLATSAEPSTYVLSDYLGSLYNSFPWAGPLRDPNRADVEIHDSYSFTPMPVSALSDLQQTLASHDIIMQIGGMGSAKKNHDDPNAVNAQFKGYMDSFIADQGANWRQFVTTRATEIAAITPASDRLTWQIGNEINAASYSQNIHYYFNDGKPISFSDLTIIPTYVEYFLAPSIQGIRHAEINTGKDIRIALGSIAAASAENSQLFMNTLLNYQIAGVYAPELAGQKVYELLDTITLHYFMGQASTTEPEQWRDYITTVRDQWLGRGAIKGIWSTEEVGVRAADSGFGAAMAIRITSRYLDWVNQNRFTSDETKWFFYGTGKGTEGTRIEQGLQDLYDLVGDNPIQFVRHELLNNNALEVYTYYVPAKLSYFMTLTYLGADSYSVDSVTTVLPGARASTVPVSGWYYSPTGRETLLTTAFAQTGKTVITLNLPTAIGEKDAVLLWLGSQPTLGAVSDDSVVRGRANVGSDERSTSATRDSAMLNRTRLQVSETKLWPTLSTSSSTSRASQ